MADFSALASAAADLRYGGQQSAIQRKLAELGVQTETNTKALTGYGDLGRPAIDEAYNILDSKLAQNRTATKTDLDTQLGKIGGHYDYAAGAGQAAANDSRAWLENLAGRMGVGSANVAAASEPMNQTMQQLAGLNARAKADALSSAGQWNSSMDAVLGQGQTIASGSRARAKSQFENSLLQALADNRLEGLKGTNNLNADLVDLLNERGAFLSTEMARLAAEQWARDMQQAELNQRASIAQAEINDRAAARAASSKESSYNRQRQQWLDSKGLAEDAKLDARYLDETKYKRSQDALSQRNLDRTFNAEQGKAQQQARASYVDMLNEAMGQEMTAPGSVERAQGNARAIGMLNGTGWNEDQQWDIYKPYHASTASGRGSIAAATQAQAALDDYFKKFGATGSNTYVQSGAAPAQEANNFWSNAWRGLQLGRR